MPETPMATRVADETRSSTVTPTNGPTRTPAHVEQDDDVERLRRIVMFPHKRKTLFTDDVELDAKLYLTP
jgi:hypothetical protein